MARTGSKLLTLRSSTSSAGPAAVARALRGPAGRSRRRVVRTDWDTGRPAPGRSTRLGQPPTTTRSARHDSRDASGRGATGPSRAHENAQYLLENEPPRGARPTTAEPRRLHPRPHSRTLPTTASCPSCCAPAFVDADPRPTLQLLGVNGVINVRRHCATCVTSCKSAG